MSLRCIPSSFGSIGPTVWEVMSFEEFQDGSHGGHLGHQNRMIQLFWISIMLQCLQSSFGSIWLMVWEEISFDPWQPSWISEQNNFSNSESLRHCNASHQDLAQSSLQFGRRCHLKNFKMAIQVAISAIRTILAILNSLCPSNASHQISAQSNLLFVRRYRLKNFKMAVWPSWILERNDFSSSEPLCHCDVSHQVLAESHLRFWGRCRLKNGGHLGYRNGTILAILNLHVTTMPPTKFQLNPTYGSGGDVKNVKSWWWTDDKWMTDNKPWHKLTWSKQSSRWAKKKAK